MGVCASKFYASDGSIQTLHRRVRPTDEQIEDQKVYWNDLADFLKGDLREKSGVAISHWLQGSYKFGTQVRPPKKGAEFDIDLGVYFGWEGKCDDGEFSATELKSMVQDSLSAYANDPATDGLRVTDPKEFCSRIIFDGDFHIDVPAYHESDDERALASASDGFVESDPRKIYDWWVGVFESETQRDQARRIVRYLKMWAGLKFNSDEVTPPSSIFLTVLVGFVFPDVAAENPVGDDERLAATVKAISSYFDSSDDNSVCNPANEKEDLNRLGDDFANFEAKLEELNGIAERALAAKEAAEAAEIWSEAFDHFFPAPAEEETEAALAKSTAVLAPVEPEVAIRVTLPSGKVTNLRNSALNVPAGSKLRFELVNYHALPANSLVRWVVRNEGAHAESVNDMGHSAGRGRSTEEETAEYAGRHYMDVTITRNGHLIGRKRVPVSVINANFTKRLKRLFYRGK